MSIRVSFSSGFGNQLFQYAAALTLAEKHEVGIQADLSSYIQTEGKMTRATFRAFELSQLGLVSNILPYRFQGLDCLRGVPRIRKILRTGGMRVYECHGEFCDSFEMLPANSYLCGYFQDKRYFFSDREVILNRIRLALDNFYPKETLLVERDILAVHLRLGDYLRHPEFHPEWTRTHIASACREIVKKYDLRGIRVFSDDLKSARSVLGGLVNEGVAVSYSQGSMIEDFAKMASSSFLLISNSTFAYWAGLLASHMGGKVIAPALWSDWCEDPVGRLYMEDWEVWGRKS